MDEITPDDLLGLAQNLTSQFKAKAACVLMLHKDGTPTIITHAMKYSDLRNLLNKAIHYSFVYEEQGKQNDE